MRISNRLHSYKLYQGFKLLTASDIGILIYLFRILEFCVFFLTQIEDVDEEVEKASYERDGTQNAEGYAKAVHSDKQTSTNTAGSAP
jgi:hypothetical protein